MAKMPARLLAAGQLKGGLVQRLLGQTHNAAVFPHPAVDLVFVQTHVFGTEGHVGVHRFFKQLVLGVLEHQAYGEPGGPGHLLGLKNILAVDEDAARGGLQKAVEMLDQGGFSAAGVSDEADELALPGGKAHIVHRFFLEGGPDAVNVGQVLHL